MNTATNSVLFKLDGPARFEDGLKEVTIQAVRGKAEIKIKAVEKAGRGMISAFGEGSVPGRVQVKIGN